MIKSNQSPPVRSSSPNSDSFRNTDSDQAFVYKSGKLSNYSAEIQELLVINDLIFCFLNLEGTYMRFDNTGKFQLDPSMSKYISF